MDTAGRRRYPRGMPRPQVHTTRDGAVAVLRLDRPPVNAVELGLAGEVEAALDEVLGGDAAALVITGTGGSFSAGLDLKVVPTYGPDEQRALLRAANRLLGKLYACRLPVVAAVNGHAIAAGCVVTLACDYRIAASGAGRLGLTEARAGIPFPAVAMTIVTAELPAHTARVLTLGARTIGPDDALRAGIVDEVVAPDAMLPRALDVARDLGGLPSESYTRIKRQLRAAPMARIADVLRRDADPLAGAWLGAETAAASAALLRGGGA
jgi:enoyl-CoA hydratase/carnithine racemase